MNSSLPKPAPFSHTTSWCWAAVVLLAGISSAQTNLNLQGSFPVDGDGSATQPFQTIGKAKSTARTLVRDFGQDVALHVAPWNYDARPDADDQELILVMMEKLAASSGQPGALHGGEIAQKDAVLDVFAVVLVAG
jgi:hypothetical protein